MSITVCAIVRDEELSLAEMLQSVQGLANEIVVIDTGSTDRTIEIANRHHAKLSSIPWGDDFAAAKNMAISKSTGDWILFLDADERLEKAHHDKVRSLVEASSKAYYLSRRHYQVSADFPYFELFTANSGVSSQYQKLGAIGYYTTNDVRLFPNSPEIRFEGALHETVEDSIRRTRRYELELTDVVIHHVGPLLFSDRQARKTKQYLSISAKKLEIDPQDWRNWFQVGVELRGAGELKKAIEHFKQATILEPTIASTNVTYLRPS